MSENEITIMIRQLSKDVRDGFAHMDEQFEGIRKELVILNKKIDILGKQVLHITAEHEIFDDRLTKLEDSSGIQ